MQTQTDEIREEEVLHVLHGVVNPEQALHSISVQRLQSVPRRQPPVHEDSQAVHDELDRYWPIPQSHKHDDCEESVHIEKDMVVTSNTVL